MELDDTIKQISVLVFEHEIQQAGYFRDNSKPLSIGICKDGLVLAGLVLGLNRSPFITALRVGLDKLEPLGLLEYYESKVDQAEYTMDEYGAQMQKSISEHKKPDSIN